MNPPRKRVVVIQRHPIVRERLAELLGAEPGLEYCGEADDLKGGMALLSTARPHLAIVGISLKDSSGLDLIKQVKALSLSTAVLVFSGRDESLYARRAVAGGARGFISKNRTSQEVLAAIRKVLDGKTYLSADVSGAMARALTARGIAAPTGRSIAQLSDRELQVLEKIGEGKDTRAISADLRLSLPSVDTYRARIKEKLNLANAFELVSFAIRWVNGLE